MSINEWKIQVKRLMFESNCHVDFIKGVEGEVSEEWTEFYNEGLTPSEAIGEALDSWEQALECFKEGIEGSNPIYLQAFIHYAHSTVREFLRLDGNFKTGLERQVAEFGLFDNKQFFIKLNRLRNAVIHDNYAVSEEGRVSGIRDL